MLIDYKIRVPEYPLQHTGYDSIPEYEFVTLIGISELGETAYQRVKMGPRETFQERLRTARYAIEAEIRTNEGWPRETLALMAKSEIESEFRTN